MAVPLARFVFVYTILEEKFDDAYMLDAVEGKLFGIGAESFTTGSNDFYLSYALTRDILWTIDAGHFHPTEDVSDKFTAFLPFGKGLMLHVSRPIRWDSDHVVILDEATTRIGETLVRNDLLDKTFIGMDFFDATINRVAAMVVAIPPAAYGAPAILALNSAARSPAKARWV